MLLHTFLKGVEGDWNPSVLKLYKILRKADAAKKVSRKNLQIFEVGVVSCEEWLFNVKGYQIPVPKKVFTLSEFCFIVLRQQSLFD